MQTWFSADYHFFHSNVIKYDNRPFKDIQLMNVEIIRKHNERVKKGDAVFFLGDFAFYATNNRVFRGEGQPYNPDDLLKEMNGNFTFVGGNHDKNSNKLKTKVNQIILNQNKLKIQLLHDPTYAKVDYDIVLCGHVHVNWKAKEIFYCGKSTLIINTGCCCWNYYPVSFDEILSIYYRWQNQRAKIKRWEIPPIIKELNKNLGKIIPDTEELE